MGVNITCEREGGEGRSGASARPVAEGGRWALAIKFVGRDVAGDLGGQQALGRVAASQSGADVGGGDGHGREGQQGQGASRVIGGRGVPCAGRGLVRRGGVGGTRQVGQPLGEFGRRG